MRCVRRGINFRAVTCPLSVGGALFFWKRPKEDSVVNGSCKVPGEVLKPSSFHIGNGNGKFTSLRAPSNAETLLKLSLKGKLQWEDTPSTSDIYQTSSPRTPLQLERALKALNVDEEWQRAVLWSLSHICDDDDLACRDEPIGRRNSLERRLNKLLLALAATLETGHGRDLVDQGILSILYDIFVQFYETNRDIFINALKVLASLAMQDEFCATAITESKWLSVLASLMTRSSIEENLLAEKICLNALSTFDCKRPQLKTDIYQLYCSTEEPLFDIVLLHGLRGGVFRTWREKDDVTRSDQTRCWPRVSYVRWL